MILFLAIYKNVFTKLTDTIVHLPQPVFGIIMEFLLRKDDKYSAEVSDLKADDNNTRSMDELEFKLSWRYRVIVITLFIALLQPVLLSAICHAYGRDHEVCTFWNSVLSLT